MENKKHELLFPPKGANGYILNVKEYVDDMSHTLQEAVAILIAAKDQLLKYWEDNGKGCDIFANWVHFYEVWAGIIKDLKKYQRVWYNPIIDYHPVNRKNLIEKSFVFDFRGYE